MNLSLIVVAIVMSALGACARFVMMEYWRASVVLVNAMASVIVGICIAWLGVQAAQQPMEQLSIWLVFGFLAGFSTVSGQVGWVYQRTPHNWQRYGLILGFVFMAAGLGWFGYGSVLWLA